MIAHTTWLHRALFPSMLWRMPGKKIYLTFDDGPHPVATPIVLDTLKRFGVRATFFLSGKNIAGNEHLVQRIVDEGHAIGIHAFTHTRALAFSKDRTLDEIRHTRELLLPFTRTPARLFRPPYGFFSGKTIAAAKELDCILVMWSCLTGDFRQEPAESVVKTALHDLSGGSILVYHDNDLTVRTIAEILTMTIPQIRARGFEFGAIR